MAPIPEGRPRIVVTIDACVGVDPEAVGPLAALELRSTLTSQKSLGELVEVDVGCNDRSIEVRVDDPDAKAPIVQEVSGRRLIELRLADPLTGKKLLRLVDLQRHKPAAQPRLLALAIAELVATSWTELITNPTPTLEPVGKVAPVEERAAAVRTLEERRWRLAGLGWGRMLVVPRAGAIGWGPALGLRASIVEPFGVVCELDASWATLSTPDGRVDVELFGGGVGAAARWRLGLVELEPGLILRVAHGRLSGVPTTAARAPATFTGPFGGPALTVAAGLSVGPFSVRVGVEGGILVWSLRGLDAGQPVVSLEGLFGAVRLGVGLEP